MLNKALCRIPREGSLFERELAARSQAPGEKRARGRGRSRRRGGSKAVAG
jgi:hypothetical protein